MPSRSYRFYTCDVFTGTRFGGNQLAVLPQADGLSDREMQQIAREFNFSETTFVFPSQPPHARRVRIFTPTKELPFAGHPNVGTAFVLASTGELGSIDSGASISFEEKAGPVAITIQRRQGGAIGCELLAPERLSLGQSLTPAAVAAAVSLPADAIVTTPHAPQVVSVGLPFVLAQLRDRAALERARPNVPALDPLMKQGAPPDILLYVHSADEFDVRARMFAPMDGVPEDPATGSANCALAGLLAHNAPARDGTFHWRIAQGIEMGRPSLLEASADKRDGAVVATRIGGTCVLVSEGRLEVD
ncbi:MAG TPA: PhzF family phenazine biosynthesis protein [Gemmatimonadales bacterium]|jgi:trans-2,3-dihydro-3-hydroxyanthranilate isomerase